MTGSAGGLGTRWTNSGGSSVPDPLSELLIGEPSAGVHDSESDAESDSMLAVVFVGYEEGRDAFVDVNQVVILVDYHFLSHVSCSHYTIYSGHL